MNGPGNARRLALYEQTIGNKMPADNRDPRRLRTDTLLTLLAVAALAAGSLVYALDRPAVSVYLLPNAWSFAIGHHLWFGAFGDHLPDLVHVYAFILLTVAVSPWPGRLLPICAGWWAVDSLFEIGQYPAIASHIAGALPAWFQHTPILDNTANYFLAGTFDPGDLVAITLGTLFAYLSIDVIRQKERGHIQDA